MTKTYLHELFCAVEAAHRTATGILVTHGPGVAYDAAADAAEALEANFEIACETYTAENPTQLSVMAW